MMQMYVLTADNSVCYSTLLPFISWSSHSTICTSPTMFESLPPMWGINGSNVHGEWTGYTGQICGFY